MGTSEFRKKSKLTGVTYSSMCVCHSCCCCCTLICRTSAVGAASAHRFNPAAHFLPLLVTLSLLRGAEQMGMHKAVKPQFGGGMRRFSCDEDNIYENIESELCFFTSQVRSLPELKFLQNIM